MCVDVSTLRAFVRLPKWFLKSVLCGRRSGHPSEKSNLEKSNLDLSSKISMAFIQNHKIKVTLA